MKKLLYLSLALVLCACSSAKPQTRSPLPSINYAALGDRIWANECAGSVSGLVSWNAGEAFPSLGIGHFIWFPAGVDAPFAESFPSFVIYARRAGLSVPTYFNGSAPWTNKSAYLADRSGKADQMREWLASNIPVQTAFIVARSRSSLPKMLVHTQQRQDVDARFRALAASTQGMYCLVDYVNFKGEGIKPSERYQGEGWGLLQVLEQMRGRPSGRAACAEFSRAAAAVLSRRVDNAPPARGERRWLAGWLNRCKTYR